MIDHQIEGDGDAYSSDVEVLRVQVDDLGVRAFTREISERGVLGDWHPKAKDMKRLGRISIRREGSDRAVEHDLDLERFNTIREANGWAPLDDLPDPDLVDAAEADAVGDMGGDDFLAYEDATGKQIGNK